MYLLYLLQCSDGTLYCGITTNLDRRVREHNSSRSGAKYTRSRRPVRLVYTKKFRKRSTALKAEYKMKQLSRRNKLQLIEQATT